MPRRRDHRVRPYFEQLERRLLLHSQPGYDLSDHVHQQLSIFVNDTPVAIPTDIGVTDTAIIANPHTHDDDGVLHYHPLNGQPAISYPTLGDFFTVWRTNAGNAGNNPNATFSANELMGNQVDGDHRILMYVNWAPNFAYDSYVLNDGDQIVLSYETIPGPNDPFLQPIGNLTAASGKPLFVPLNATDPQGDALTYTVTTSVSDVAATVLKGDRLLRLDVSGTDDEGNPFAGTMLFYLFESLVPNTTSRIIQLVQSGFYDGLTFHRIIDGFMIQGGDPNGEGTGGSGVRFDDAFRPALTFTGFGQLAMANAGDDTNDSQFFITDTNLSLNMQSSPSQLPPQHLNFQHTIFGQLVSGFDIYEKIITTPTDSSDRPLNTVTITDASIVNDPGRAVLMISPAEGFTGDATVEVTVEDPQGNSDFRRFNVRVLADTVNDPPFLGPVADQQTLEEQPVQFTVSATDLENDDLTFVVRDPFTFQPSSAVDVSIVNNQDGTATVTLTPRKDVAGVVQLLLGVRDQTARSGLPLDHRNQFDTQRFLLTVTPVNDPPVAQDITVSTPEETAVSIQLSADDGDPETNQTLTYELVDAPTNGTISNFDPDAGTLTYTPNPGFVGTDTFTYRVRDDGGTDNGGSDTSELATVTVQVGPVPDPPVNIGLSPATDTGQSDSDGFTRHPRPIVRVQAAPGMQVRVKLNGTDIGLAREVEPGTYELRLNPRRHPLRLGRNELTAIVEQGAQRSSEPEPVPIVWAPSFARTYVVPGEPGEQTRLRFRLTHRIAEYANELGVVVVDGPGGAIGDVRPGDEGYAAQLLRSETRRTLFRQSDPVGTTRTVRLPAGSHLVFYLVQNATVQQWLSANPDNLPDRNPIVFFSLPGANPDGLDHMRQAIDPYTGAGQYFWEDLLGGGDADFNDLVIEVKPEGTTRAHESLRATGPVDGSVELTAALQTGPDGDDRVKGEFGVFRVDSPDGTLDGTQPGDDGYLDKVAASARTVLLNADDAAGIRRSVELVSGTSYGFYYVVGGTFEQARQLNPQNDPSVQPYVLFSFDAANPGGLEAFRWFEAERHGIRPDRLSSLTDDVLRLHVVDRVLEEGTDWLDAMIVELTLEA